MREVEVIINEDGSVTIRYQGFRGQACFEEAKRLYRRLREAGVEVKVEKTQPTEEFYMAETTTQRLREHVGAY